MKRYLAVCAMVAAASPSWAQGFIQDPGVYGGLGYAVTSLDDD